MLVHSVIKRTQYHSYSGRVHSYYSRVMKTLNHRWFVTVSFLPLLSTVLVS